MDLRTKIDSQKEQLKRQMRAEIVTHMTKLETKVKNLGVALEHS